MTEARGGVLIVVPTKGRVDKQRTVKRLPKELRVMTVLVCPAAEAPYHKRADLGVGVLAQPDPAWTIARKRRWILEELAPGRGADKVIMLDDDLEFSVRRPDNPARFLVARPDQVLPAFVELARQLSPAVPHAGFAVRQGADKNTTAGWIGVGRMMYSLGYHVPTVLANAELGRIETREDMDLTLQLLRKGLPNDIYNSFTAGQGFGNPGGCTGERTLERSNADARRLAELFPGYVRVEERQYKNSPVRLEVTCYWQKAYRDALAGR